MLFWISLSSLFSSIKDSVEKDKMLLEKENYDISIQKKYFEKLEDEKKKDQLAKRKAMRERTEEA